MEKVWVELKKIEAEAEQIRVEAQEKAQSIRALAKREVRKLFPTVKLMVRRRRSVCTRAQFRKLIEIVMKG